MSAIHTSLTRQCSAKDKGELAEQLRARLIYLGAVRAVRGHVHPVYACVLRSWIMRCCMLVMLLVRVATPHSPRLGLRGVTEGGSILSMSLDVACSRAARLKKRLIFHGRFVMTGQCARPCSLTQRVERRRASEPTPRATSNLEHLRWAVSLCMRAGM